MIIRLVASGLLLGLATLAADRPNILLITADDLGCVLSCYGEKRITTPRLDALAAEGVRFEHAYVAQSSCSPSRAALLTGRWPHQNGQIGLSHLGFTMKPGIPNLPALLKAGGYRTGIVGKLHVEPAAEFQFDWMPKEKLAAGPTRNMGWVAEQCRTFFSSARQSGQPFFHYVNYFDPHGPLNAETDQVGGLPEKPLRPAEIADPLPFKAPVEQARRGATARLFNAVLRLDAGIGMLMDELQKAGFASNTVVIFVGDNGLAIERGKTTSYEPGVRVPMLVRWPGVAKTGHVSKDLVSLVDVVPTVLRAAGIAPPTGLAGLDLTDALDGASVRREFICTEMNFHEPDIFRPQRSIRDNRYKLLRHLLPADGQPALELFDLQTDPGEEHNLAAESSHRTIRARLEKALAEWQTATDDPLMEPGRVERWQAARDAWAKLPRVQAGAGKVVHIPAGDLERLH